MPECRCRTKRCKLTENLWCRAELFIHVCPLSRSMPHYQIHAACPCPCCMSMPMSLLHAMSMLHVHVNADSMSMLHSISMLHSMSRLMSMSMSLYIYVEMSECRTVQHPVSPVPDRKKLTMPEQVRYRTKKTHSDIFLVWYRTKIWDARMPMPALVSSMPLPSYGYYYYYLFLVL